ncbi:MAG: hypothetical protein RLY93_04470 [Sumerlaeia bacterium]
MRTKLDKARRPGLRFGPLALLCPAFWLSAGSLAGAQETTPTLRLDALFRFEPAATSAPPAPEKTTVQPYDDGVVRFEVLGPGEGPAPQPVGEGTGGGERLRFEIIGDQSFPANMPKLMPRVLATKPEDRLPAPAIVEKGRDPSIPGDLAAMTIANRFRLMRVRLTLAAEDQPPLVLLLPPQTTERFQLEPGLWTATVEAWEPGETASVTRPTAARKLSAHWAYEIDLSIAMEDAWRRHLEGEDRFTREARNRIETYERLSN